MAKFIPALRFKFLTPVYARLSGFFNKKNYEKILSFLSPKKGATILDVGCGPGNLMVLLKKRFPGSEVYGLDVDPQILEYARINLKKSLIEAEIINAGATEIPTYRKYDIVISTLVFHHLKTEDKIAAMEQVRKVLKPGGCFFLFDFGPPQNLKAKLIASLLRHFEEVDDAFAGKYKTYMERAGFKKIESLFHYDAFQLLKASH